MGKRHNCWWIVAPKQLKKGERVHVGFRSRTKALVDARTSISPCEVRKLDTIENPRPTDDPKFNPQDNYRSSRFCIVYKG